MANTTFASTPLLGINFDEKRTTVDGPSVAVGTVVQLQSSVPARIGKFAMYIQANGAIANSSYVTVALTSISCLGSSVDAGASGTAYTRNGSVAFADSEYGWVYIVRTQVFQN